MPYGSEEHDGLSLLISELAANAVTHGHVPGRDFRVHLLVLSAPAARSLTVRVEVADTRGDELPASAVDAAVGSVRTGGRGLLLVGALADRWGCEPRPDGPGKTVWTEYAVARCNPSAVSP
ncbi:ATP-binding protein [Streptomyces adustus]|uniref:ATP-binding protein n=1 Tax=Streptomyces adustus TaxID=1609272 RepID=UPI0035DE7AAF